MELKLKRLRQSVEFPFVCFSKCLFLHKFYVVINLRSTLDNINTCIGKAYPWFSSSAAWPKQCGAPSWSSGVPLPWDCSRESEWGYKEGLEFHIVHVVNLLFPKLPSFFLNPPTGLEMITKGRSAQFFSF